ncbi:phosphoglucosamine mutase [Cerasicoccus arenae]|uniref:Phosphoglucosamine mutase n=1 Tax=Cerasicoccus arenae TaxID=424488 RepID=A0A8J3DFW5_9BACT|nr:phosphoglucosamine mutase [Cerasicoccus arenae]MBK1859423.1 phosphoglucosamine mutase [Cerasicoccus arenae]GHB94027.1 phosphoglucosamine mutase [Cerasicoccus arenae]
MKLKYFGTDGIRGKVGGDVLTHEFVRRAAYGISAFMRKHNQAKPITVVIGRDTRASGVELEALLCEALCQDHIHVIRLGVLPTPGVSMSLRDLHADLGVAITASHNPASDNGLKFFDNRGLKFSEQAEAEIERFIDAAVIKTPDVNNDCGHDYDGSAFYINVLRSLMHQDCLKGWKVVVDTANGATTTTTPAVFRHFGAEIIQLGAEPDGQNINEGVGSECPDKLAAAVKKHGARLGVAHDGDGDRLVICDELGRIVHGDQLLGVLGLYGIKTGRLRKKTVIATVHSNMGLDRAIAQAGGKVERVDVGDRNVLHRMLEGDFNFGGESSGHIIFRDYSVAGDGLLAAIQLLSMLLETKLPLSEHVKAVELFPQLTRNLKVAEKRPLADCPSLSKAIAELDEGLAGRGRILVRYSGTEPKLRLLAEAETDAIAAETIEKLEAAARVDLDVLN